MKNTKVRIALMVISAFVVVAVLTIIVYFTSQSSTSRRMVGYYKETATGFQCSGIPEMIPARIPSKYYTHLVYCFSPPINMEKWEFEASSSELERYSTFNKLKANQPSLRTFLSLGGDLPSTQPMSLMAVNQTSRDHYVKTSVAFIKAHGFDGVDLDWEYPGDVARGGSLLDQASFIELAKALRRATLEQNLLFTVALPGGQYWGRMFTVNVVSDYVDWFNIMAYNVLGTWNSVTGCSSPLNSKNAYNDSVENAVSYFTSLAPTSKFNLGISFWGIVYKLTTAVSSSNMVHIGSASYSGQTADPGWCTKQPGYLSYFEIQQLLDADKSISVTTSQEGACKYFVYGNSTAKMDQWVAFDDTSTYSTKINYAFSKGLGGVSIWGMDSDLPHTWPLTLGVSSQIKSGLEPFSINYFV